MSVPPSGRRVAHVYRDPLDEIWLRAAARLGLAIERTDEVYASYDGRGTLRLSTAQHLDPDDSLAQLILHEICHALVTGAEALEREDWGLSNVDEQNLVDEHACHRVQAALARCHGLRALFAVTTDHRPYWDALPEDPLADDGDPAVALARRAFERAQQAPFAEVLNEALASTAAIARAVRPHCAENSLWALAEPTPDTGDEPE